MAKGYQNYRGRHSAGARAAIVLLVVVLIVACASIFAQQYIVYADDGGIYLDLPFLGRVDLPAPPKPEPEPEEPAEPEDPPVNLVVQQPEEEEPETEPEPEPADVFGEHRVLELTDLPADEAALAEALAGRGATGFLYTVRDNTGRILWASESGQSKAVSANEAATETLRTLCGAEDVLAVARFNVLHDSYYAFANMKDAAICQKNGYVWYDNHSYHWLEPDKELARTYVTGLAAECARLGFDELLLEELSYPTQGNLYKMSLDNNTRGKTEALVQLLTELRAAVEPYGTKLSLLLTEELIMAGADETSGVDLAAMLPLVDGVYADVSSAAAAQALLQAAVGEGNEAPALVCLLAEPGERESWCIPAA